MVRASLRRFYTTRPQASLDIVECSGWRLQKYTLHEKRLVDWETIIFSKFNSSLDRVLDAPYCGDTPAGALIERAGSISER